MRLLITGACGFVGSALIRSLVESGFKGSMVGLDNFIRPGSETNRERLRRDGVRLVHGDIRQPSDLESLPPVDFVIDAAANPSVLAGVDGKTSSRQLVEHNLTGTVNMLEYCKAHKAGFILLSTSRVYSIPPLASLPVTPVDGAFRPAPGASLPPGVSERGVDEAFSTAAPVSLYGATKLSSEVLALEYGASFGLPVFVNRCGVLAGAGQFGRADQGIFAFWLNAHLRRRPLKYIGFDGQGHQVRDCLHPRDVAALVRLQLAAPAVPMEDRIVNVSGGAASARSLRQLTAWCDARFGMHTVGSEPAPRPFDIPWMVLDSSKAGRVWSWAPSLGTEAILDEIASHAAAHPTWLDLSAPL
jgi:CDP-paratose 2-epimerase